MITEQEAREAASRVCEMVEDRDAGEFGVVTAKRLYGTTDIEMAARSARRDVDRVVTWMCDELARREADQAERAKPIDAEWLASIGSRCPKSERWFILLDRTYGPSRYETQLRAKMQPEGCYVIVTQGYGDDADDDDKEDVVSFAYDFTTRGQLLDLLASLKGGAT